MSRKCYRHWTAIGRGAILLLLVGLAGCATGTPAGGERASPSAPAAAPSAGSPGGPSALLPLTVAYGAISGNTVPLWLAKDRGLFEAEGLDVELVYLQSSSQVAKSMASGEIPLAVTAAAGVIDANLAGSDQVVISGFNNYMFFRLFGAPAGIERVEQLRDGKVGIGRFGSGIDMAARLSLERHGLVGGRDTALIQLGTEMDIVGATLQGLVDAGMVGFPVAYEAERLGLRLLDDTYTYRMPFISGSVITSRAFIDGSDDVLRRFIRAHIASLGLYYCDKDAAKRSMASWARLDDPDVLEKTYQTFAETFERIPYPPAAGLQSVLDFRAQELPEARTANVAAWLDDRYVRDVDTSGYLAQAYACGGPPTRS